MEIERIPNMYLIIREETKENGKQFICDITSAGFTRFADTLLVGDRDLV